MEIFTYTDRFFLTLALQTYLDRRDPNSEECEIIRRILRNFLKNEQEFRFSDNEGRVIARALEAYPKIGMCNKLVLEAVEELTLKLKRGIIV